MESTANRLVHLNDNDREQSARCEARIARGQVQALFAFDIGYEISFEKLSDLFPSVPVQSLSPKKQTPAFTQYTRPPRILNLGACDVLFGEAGQIRATLFDFGVASVSYRWAVGKDAGLPIGDLPAMSQLLYQSNLVAKAWEQVRRLAGRIEQAISRPNLSPLVEDYYLFIIERLDTSLQADELLRRYKSVLAQTLRFETTLLSQEQQDDALRQKLCYYDSDLVLIDWNAAIICDQDYDDAANVLELLNVELLEARYIDSVLDRRIQEQASVVHGRTQWPIPLRTPFRKAIQELGELRLESALLAERLGNSLKLIGDLYLARVYSAAADRFYLRQWQKIIADKLDTIDSFYELVTDRVRTAQSQTLELAVIVLILVEVFLALARH
jgi:hypothetical protein